MTLCCRRRHSL